MKDKFLPHRQGDGLARQALAAGLPSDTEGRTGTDAVGSPGPPTPAIGPEP